MIDLLAAARWAQLLVGLALYAFAAVLMIRSGLGLGPWDAFHVGLARIAGVSVGTASIGVGIAIVGATWCAGLRPGPGTAANMVLVGVFIDLFLPAVPGAAGWTALPYHAAGIVLIGAATGCYIGAGLGKGPRDGLMLEVSERTGVSVGRVRTSIELVVLLLGWLMGARVGAGTVLYAVTIGPVTQWGLRAFGARRPAPAAAAPAAAQLAAPVVAPARDGAIAADREVACGVTDPRATYPIERDATS